MPITIAQIKTLQHLSVSNFRKFECQSCAGEYFSIRESKYCSSACKQAGYRARLLSEETKEITKEEEVKMPSTIIKKSIDVIEELKIKNNYYNQKLKAI
jgi:hypothetical protein